MNPLYTHQKKIIDEDPKRCGVFLGTGGGKSRTALMLAQGKVLIIMPKTQYLDQNWAREASKLDINLDITEMSKEQFKRDHETLPVFDTVIIDEAHTVLGVTPSIRWRNKQPIPKASQIFEAVYGFIKRTNPHRLYLLTATPARNPMCIWAAGALLGKNWNWEAWRQMFYVKLPMPGREIWQVKKDSKSKELLAAYVKSIGYVGRLDDWFDIPPQVEKTITCPLTLTEEKAIKDLPLSCPDPLVLIGKTHQVEQGILRDSPGNLNNKLGVIEELLLEYPKVIIFCRYLDQIGMIDNYLREKGIKTYVMTGGTKNRKAVIEEAEASEECAFIAQSQISTGYELPSFRCTIFASMSYSYVDLVQAKGRNLRANKLNKNLYVYLVSGKIDRAVIDCMHNHKDFDERLYAGISDIHIKRYAKTRS